MESHLPQQVEPYSSTELYLSWNNGEKFRIPYTELRYLCPCAGCVNEFTGLRTIQKTSVSRDIRPLQVEPIGRYALKISWSDGHSTGMYSYDRLYEISKTAGLPA